MLLQPRLCPLLGLPMCILPEEPHSSTTFLLLKGVSDNAGWISACSRSLTASRWRERSEQSMHSCSLTR